jgi:hypothetical protein
MDRTIEHKFHMSDPLKFMARDLVVQDDGCRGRHLVISFEEMEIEQFGSRIRRDQFKETENLTFSPWYPKSRQDVFKQLCRLPNNYWSRATPRALES